MNDNQIISKTISEIIKEVENLEIFKIDENFKQKLEQRIINDYQRGGEKLVLAKKQNFLKKCQAKFLEKRLLKLREENQKIDKEIAFFERELIDLLLKRLIFDFYESGISSQEFLKTLQNASFTLFREQSKKTIASDFAIGEEEFLEPFIDATEAFKVELIKEELEKKEKDLEIYKIILDCICSNGYDPRATYDEGYQLAFLNRLKFFHNATRKVDFERLKELFFISVRNRKLGDRS